VDWSRRVAVRVSGRNRQRKLHLFMDTFRPDSATRVLDVGFAEGSWMPDANYLEQHYPWPRQLTANGRAEGRPANGRWQPGLGGRGLTRRSRP
jgi:hypothetical protein